MGQVNHARRNVNLRPKVKRLKYQTSFYLRLNSLEGKRLKYQTSLYHRLMIFQLCLQECLILLSFLHKHFRWSDTFLVVKVPILLSPLCSQLSTAYRQQSCDSSASELSLLTWSCHQKEQLIPYQVMKFSYLQKQRSHDP